MPQVASQREECFDHSRCALGSSMTLLLRQLRSGVLAHARIEASFAQIGPQLAGPSCLQLLRSFAAGTYLDKSQVTDRVLNVVKNFEKVDPSKVCAS